MFFRSVPHARVSSGTLVVQLSFTTEYFPFQLFLMVGWNYVQKLHLQRHFVVTFVTVRIILYKQYKITAKTKAKLLSISL